MVARLQRKSHFNKECFVMDINLRDIKKLIDLLDNSTVGEIEITQDKESIRLSRSSGAEMAQAAQAAPLMAPAAAAPLAPETPAQLAVPVDNTPAGHKVKSPMVGTFYRKASPEAANFAEVGQSVAEGDTLCIIEAMKMMNEIVADKSGTVKAVLIEDGTPVEFDEPLFVIE
jgi:acetyl-CoA carboxylase biotin carboxyl carrier protein